MEDEECLPENSDLNVYLRNLGYSDISTTIHKQNEENALNFEVRTSKSEKFTAGWLDKDVVEQIEILLSTKMLFEEDVSNMEKLLSNFKIVKTGLLKSMFQNNLTAFIIAFGVCLYWVIGNYVFVLISVFYAYHASDYLWRKHYSQNRIKNLMTALKSNYILLKKTLYFIKENDLLLQQNFPDGKNENQFEFFENLKKEFIISENELIRILSKATQKLINKVPLYDYVENPQFYLCNKYSETFSEISDLSKLHQVYLLVQSEFLQRVALSLIPNLQKTVQDNYKDMNKILSGTTFALVKLENRLSKKFKFVFINGIHFNTFKSGFKLPTNKESHPNHALEFVSNIHDTSNTLQSLLIKSRVIEDKFNSEILPKDIEDELVSIQNDLVMCQKNISDSVILLKKLNAITSDSKLKMLEEDKKEINSVIDESDKILVGFTDLDPEVEDEIFEAYFNTEDTKDKYIEDDFDFEDRLKKKLEREYSKKVLKELKSRLVETAKEWQIREEKALQRKSKSGKIEDIKIQEESAKNDRKLSEPKHNLNYFRDESGVVEIDTESSWPLPQFKRCSIVRKNNRIVQYKEQSSEKEANEEFENNNCKLPNLDNLKSVNINFLSSINDARSKILNLVAQEETFCDTGENSEDEEEILKSALINESIKPDQFER